MDLRQHFELSVLVARNPTLGPYSGFHTHLAHTEVFVALAMTKPFPPFCGVGLYPRAELSDYFPPAGLSFWLDLLSLKFPYGSK